MRNKVMGSMLILAVSTMGAACARSPQSPNNDTDASKTQVGAVQVPTRQSTGYVLPLVVVNKNASCGCCKAWVDHMRKAGFTVEVHDLDNLEPIKARVGVPAGKGSCHTAEVGGYFVEGHVPADDIKRLLAEQPDAKGLVVPGMPMGSPGMEMPDGTAQPYAVELVQRDGTTTVFAQH